MAESKKSTRHLGDVSTFLDAIRTIDDPMMFRGQSRDWSLLPSLARFPGLVDGYDDWRVLQQDVLEKFARLARPKLRRVPTDTEEWLVHAQHHGVPTKLLDWTTNPLKALFWAVEDDRGDNEDGVVWAFTPVAWRDDSLRPTPLRDEDLTPYFPKHLNERVVAQEACFVSFPLPKNHDLPLPMEATNAYPQSVMSLVKHIIPAGARRSLRIELTGIGISHRFLFPDLDGIAKQINMEMRQGGWIGVP